MEKKNTLLLTVIAIATLLVAVVGATFAYFATTQNIDNGRVNITATTDPAASVFLANGEDLTLAITAEQMDTTLAGNVANSASKNLVVTYGSSATDHLTNCTYDVVFKWNDDSPAKYLSTEEITKPTDPTLNSGKEFTITIGAATVTGYSEGTTAAAVAETNIDYDTHACVNPDTAGSYSTEAECTEAGGDWEGSLVLINDATINANTVYATTGTCPGHADKTTELDCENAGGEWTETHSGGTTVTWPVEVKFYNLEANQNHLADKTYAGRVEITDVKC